MATTRVLLKFTDDDNYYRCEVQRMSEHMIKVIGLIQDLSGFQIFSDSLVMIGDYSAYTYEYANPYLDSNTYEYTDNGAKYPSEGADKSQKEQIKEELEAYTDTLISKAKKTLNDTVTEVQTEINKSITELNESASTQIDEIQASLLEVYEAVMELVNTINATVKTETDTETTDTSTDTETKTTV